MQRFWKIISPHKINTHINTIPDKTSPKMNHILKKNFPEDWNNCKYTMSLKLFWLRLNKSDMQNQLFHPLTIE